MGVKLQSALGGSVELNAPSTASNFSMTVPAGNGTVATTDQIVGFRNRLINGDMKIHQRGTSGLLTAGVITLDRWNFQGVYSKISFAQNLNGITPPAGFSNYIGFQVTTAYPTMAAGDWISFGQKIEGYNVADLNWGTANASPITLSFWIRSSVTGTYGGSVTNQGADGQSTPNYSYPFTFTISSANTWEYKTVSIPGPTSGSWTYANQVGLNINIALGCGTTLAGTAGTWTSANYYSATGCINFAATAGATVYATGFQVEKGLTATPFEQRPYPLELDMCKRYYQPYSYWYHPDSLWVRITVPYLVTPRAAPSVTYSAQNGGTGVGLSIDSSGSYPFGCRFYNDGSYGNNDFIVSGTFVSEM